MSKKAKKTDAITDKGALQLIAEKQGAMREAIAAELECQLGMGCFDDACDTVTLEDRNYVTRVVTGLLTTLRATPVKGV
jgi:hypothetical protein